MNQNKNPRRSGRGQNLAQDSADSRINSTPIYSGIKVVGQVKDGVFIKKVSASRHFLRRPPAIAFDVDSLNQAAANGAIQVQVADNETGFVYSTTMQHVQERGFEFDRGFGRQIALVLSEWTKTQPGQLPFSQPMLF
jgi:hypothetical protein